MLLLLIIYSRDSIGWLGARVGPSANACEVCLAWRLHGV
jgi:hypothetical protein